MLKAYTIIELAQKEKMTEHGILYRIKKGEYYIPVRIDGKPYEKNKK